MKVTDSGLYQLIVEFLLLIDTLPESLDDYIPFLNPTALNLNLKSGIIAKLLSAAGLNPFQLASISSEESSSAYCYDLSIGEETISFNGDEHYREALPQSRVFLYGLLKEYFAVYGETLHVKNERAKARLIQNFMAEEIDWVQSKVKPYNDRYQDLNKSFPIEIGHADKLDLLKQQMVVANQLLLDIEQLIEGMSHRNYQQQTFADLLAMHDMTDALEADSSSKLDVSYAASVLPTILIAEDNKRNFIAISVQQTLQTTLSSTLDDFSRLQKQIEERKQIFAQQGREILQEWHEAEIKRHQRENERWLRRLEGFHKEVDSTLRLNEIAMLDNSDNFDLQIQLISKQLEDLAQHQEKLKQYESQLEIIQEELDKPVSCPAGLCQDDSTMTQEAERCYAASKEEMSLCVQELRESANLFKSRREALEKQLRKAQAAKAFTETMRSSNPEIIEKLLDAKKEQIRISLIEQEKTIQSVNERRLQMQRDEEGAYLSSAMLEKSDPLAQWLAKRARVTQDILGEIQANSKQILEVEPHFTTYFDIEKLHSLAGSAAAQDYLNKIFEEQRALENVEDYRDYPQMFAALSAAYDCINDSKGSFPFKLLASLPVLKAFVIGKSNGFEALLTLLDDESTTRRWLDYNKSAPPGAVLLEQKNCSWNSLRQKIEL
ncbi:hypothetical protein [Legionella tunisiensis]|uniref:hypothetical protein n=1 Tax=Legionella tunisiensis TaxID=1034944 RepID=UPI0002E1EEC5|nr:hypothetical protein [Legionella tunisiensis]